MRDHYTGLDLAKDVYQEADLEQGFDNMIERFLPQWGVRVRFPKETIIFGPTDRDLADMQLNIFNWEHPVVNGDMATSAKLVDIRKELEEIIEGK